MTTQQENALEQALRLAVSEPAHRPEFYRLLLESSVFVRGQAPDGAAGSQLQGGEQVQVMRWPREDGSASIPFFSTPQGLANIFGDDAGYLEMPGRALFTMCGGNTVFVLNPGGDYGKEFFPQEIEQLLHNGGGAAPQERTVPADTRVLLGAPANYPQRLVDALGVLLARHPSVRAAYLTLMHDPSQDPQPTLVVGIDSERDDMDTLAREAGVVIAEHGPAGEPVDLMQIRRGEAGLSEYFLGEVKPFYERKRPGLLKSLLGFGR